MSSEPVSPALFPPIRMFIDYQDGGREVLECEVSYAPNGAISAMAIRGGDVASTALMGADGTVWAFPVDQSRLMSCSIVRVNAAPLPST